VLFVISHGVPLGLRHKFRWKGIHSNLFLLEFATDEDREETFSGILGN
jgi:hypothetical protein